MNMKCFTMLALGMLVFSVFLSSTSNSSTPSMPIQTAVDKEVIEYGIDPTNADASDICFNTHNNHAYFTLYDYEEFNYKIGAMDEDGNFENYTINEGMRIMWGGHIIFNSHDNCMYFIEYDETDYYIGKMSESGIVTDYVMPEDYAPNDICFDANENEIYATAFAVSNHSYYKVFSMTEAGVFTGYDLYVDKVFEGEIVFNTHDNYLYVEAHPASNSTVEIIKMSEDGMTFDNYTYGLDVYTNTLIFNDNDNCVYGRALNATSVIKMYKMNEDGEFTVYELIEQVTRWCFSTYDDYIYAQNGSSYLHYFKQISSIGSIQNYTFDTIEEYYLAGIVANSHNGNIYVVGQNGDTSNGSIFVLTDVETEPTPPPPTPYVAKGITVTITQAGDWTLANDGTMTANVGSGITIRAQIECVDGIDMAQVIYTAVGGSEDEIINMEMVSGTDEDGIWQATIPAQIETGTLSFQISVVSDADKEITTTASTLSIVSGTSATTLMLDTTTLLIFGSIGIIAVMAVLWFARGKV